MSRSKNKILISLLILCIGVVVLLALIDFFPSSTPPSDEPQTDVQQSEEAADKEQPLSAEEIKEQDRKRLVEEWLQELTLEEKVGQMFMPQIEMWEGENATAMNAELQRKIRDFHLGGIILFEKNIESIESVVTLNDQIQREASRLPLFISIDQEGGSVKRIPGGTNMPGNMALGATRDKELAYEAGRVIGSELHALGVNLNFAPSLDVNNNPNNPVIGVRSFSEDPALVAGLGVPYIQGLRDTNVIATAKHFPGHGDTDVDSHLGLPVLDFDRERLEQVELYPFRQAIEQGIDMVMTAHITFPKIDNTQFISKKDGSSNTIPATLSYKILTELLREELGFKGVIVTDSFLMNAIREHFGEEDAVIQSIQAGADIILMPADLESAYDRVLQEVKDGQLSEERIDESVRRILLLKAKYGLLPEVGAADGLEQGTVEQKIELARQTVGNEEHRYIEQKISEAAITLLKDEGDTVPFALAPEDRILIIAPSQTTAQRLVDELHALRQENITEDDGAIENAEENNEIGPRLKWNGDVNTLIYPEESSSVALSTAIQQADYVLLASHNISQLNTGNQTLESFRGIVDALNKQDVPYVWMSLGTPYDIVVQQNARAYMALYGSQPPNLRAGLRAVFEGQSIDGKLPVTIPKTTQANQEADIAAEENVLFPFGTGLEK